MSTSQKKDFNLTIGSTINTSIPTVGTTVDTLNRVDTRVFMGTYTGVSGGYPVKLDLRTASVLGNTKNFGLTMRVTPSQNDDPGSLSKGNATCAINVSGVVGSVITPGELAEFVRYALSVALKSNLIEDLMSGNSQ